MGPECTDPSLANEEPLAGTIPGVPCEVRFRETRASPADQILKGLRGRAREAQRPRTGRGWALRPSRQRDPLRDRRCSFHSCPRPSAPPALPAKNSLFWGLHTRRPAPPAGPEVREEGAPLLLTPPTQGPKLKPLDGSVSGASLGNSGSQLSLFLTLRAPGGKEGAGGVPSLGLSFAFCESHPSHLSGACNRGLITACTFP